MILIGSGSNPHFMTYKLFRDLCINVSVCTCECVVCRFFNKSGKLITHHYSLGMILRFWISSREWATDKSSTSTSECLAFLYAYDNPFVYHFVIWNPLCYYSEKRRERCRQSPQPFPAVSAVYV